jgi:hypothetical protein
MKVTAQSLTDVAVHEKAWPFVLADLVKARLSFLVVLTTLTGFYVATRGAVDWTLLAHTILGTALLACGAAALNQLWEREHDARMRRTQNRPLPSGRLQPETVLILGGASSVAGLAELALGVNLLTSLLGGLTLAVYLFIYTPLKRLTWLNSVICHLVLLADPSFLSDCLVVSRRIREGRVCHVALGGYGRLANRAPSRESHLWFVARQPQSVRISVGRTHLPVRRPRARAVVSWAGV